jgi:hypothetical protein
MHMLNAYRVLPRVEQRERGFRPVAGQPLGLRFRP